MVHSPRIELGSLGLRGRTSPAKFAVDGFVIDFLLRAI